MLAAVILFGCGKDRKQQADDRMEDFMVRSATADLAKVKDALASGKPGDARYTCVTALSATKDLEKSDDHAALVKDVKQTCEHDFPLAVMKVETEKVEVARKAKPDEKVLSECYDAYFDMAVKDVKKHATEDDAAKALEARFAAACPKMK